MNTRSSFSLSSCARRLRSAAIAPGGLTILAVLATGATVATAQTGAVHPGHRPGSNLADLRFAIESDERRGAEASFIRDGQRFALGVGQRLVIRAVGDDPGQASSRVYPPTSYRIVSGGDLARLLDERPKGGTVVIEGLGQGGANRIVRIEWQLDAGVLPSDGRTRGVIEAELPPAAYGPGSWAGWAGDESARSIVRHLYLGILLREPDAGGQHWVDLIRSRGYDGVTEAASQIAASAESQRDIYGRGVSNAQRLAAMYEHLQGRAQATVPLAEWNDHLALLDQRYYEYVTLAILAGDPFFTRHQLVRPGALRSPVRPRPIN